MKPRQTRAWRPPELRYLDYGLCLLCALAWYWQSRYSALIAMAESSVNLLILLAGVMVPIIDLGNLAGDTGRRRRHQRL